MQIPCRPPVPVARTTGQLLPVSADDGAHYARSVKMAGAGAYKVTLKDNAPDEAGYAGHIDKATGIPLWFVPFTETFTFHDPQ
ncbi:iron transporter [Tatumella sp. UBA2305]|uniref:iron transporter n=1 Tax=Tatumella sp. UBA2305 TaxID=1947647 RepID=UPI0025DA7486|nr:iron transporter [Tatumella sp. UBA2305]